MEERCSMCAFRTGSATSLMKHVVRFHKTDPRLIVNCSFGGCNATYTKWGSFRQHVYRCHPAERAALEDDLPEDHQQPDDGNGDVNQGMEFNNPFHHEEDAERTTVSLQDLLRWQMGIFLLSIREECRLSQVAMTKIIEGMDSLLTDLNNTFLDEMRGLADPETQLVSIAALEETYELFSVPRLLSKFKTKYLLDQFLEEECGLIRPQQVYVGTESVWVKTKNGTVDVVDKKRYAYTVPFLPMVKSLLENDQIRHCIDNPRPKVNGEYFSVLDGSFYRESDFFSSEEKNVGAIGYYDDLHVTKDLSPTTAKSKLAMFYFTISNVYPELRSKLSAIHLLCIVDYNVLKMFGVEKILSPFKEDIVKFQNDGITVKVDGVDKIYKGSLLFFSGDTPALAFVGGFKQSVSAIRFCRTCEVKQDDWKIVFAANAITLRSKENHDSHLEMVCDENIPANTRQFWKRRFGVNGKCCLSDIPGFDVTKCLPQDVMHVLTEGVLEVHVRVYLRFLIETTGVIKLSDLNAKLLIYDFKLFKKDRPAPILAVHLNNGLRQSACQMITLAIFLPFLLEELGIFSTNQEILNEIKKRQKCFGLLLPILNTCMAYSITDTAVDYLERMIEVHHLQFVELYPDSITPKFHFLIHVGYYTRLFGPPRQQACFRFEALHSNFKTLVPVVKNTINLPFTLSYRHQVRSACRLAHVPGQSSKKILGAPDVFSPGSTVLVANLLERHLFDGFVMENERIDLRVMRTSQAVINGMTFKENTVVLWKLPDDDLPIFAKVEELFVLKKELLMKVSFLSSIEHDSVLNAYQVEHSGDSSRLIKLSDLSFPHPLLYLSLCSDWYVVLLYNCRIEHVV